MEFGSAASLEENLSTTLHELTHVLGFASYMYNYFLNPNTGKPLTGHVKYFLNFSLFLKLSEQKS